MSGERIEAVKAAAWDALARLRHECPDEPRAMDSETMDVIVRAALAAAEPVTWPALETAADRLFDLADEISKAEQPGWPNEIRDIAEQLRAAARSEAAARTYLSTPDAGSEQ